MKLMTHFTKFSILAFFLFNIVSAGELGFEEEYGNEPWFGSKEAARQARLLLQQPSIQNQLVNYSTPEFFGKCSLVFTLLMDQYTKSSNVPLEQKINLEYFTQSVLFLKHHYIAEGLTNNGLQKLLAGKMDLVISNLSKAKKHCSDTFRNAVVGYTNQNQTKTENNNSEEKSNSVEIDILDSNKSEPAITNLTVISKPSNSKVRILNISPKYKDGIKLESGKYHIEVSASGYETYKKWYELGIGKQTIQIKLVKSNVRKQSQSGEYKYYKDGSCASNCVSLNQMQKLCKQVNSINVEAINISSNFDYQLQQLIKNAGISGIGFLDAITDPVAGCVVVFNAQGILNGNTFHKTYACDALVLKDGSNGGYIATYLDPFSCASK